MLDLIFSLVAACSDPKTMFVVDISYPTLPSIKQCTCIELPSMAYYCKTGPYWIEWKIFPHYSVFPTEEAARKELLWNWNRQNEYLKTDHPDQVRVEIIEDE